MKTTITVFTIFCSLLLISKVNAQSPTIKWWYDVNDASFGQSAAGDIDGDGKLEIVFGCYRNDSSVYALNAEDGSLLWKYNTHSSGAEGCNDVAPIIYDVDGDGNLEVILPSSCNPKTFCFDGATEAVKWVCNTRGSDSPPTIADIDGDGVPEILHGEFGGYVICIKGNNGTPQWEIAVDLDSWIQTAPTIVDLNNDGNLDFVVATWNNVNADSNAVYAYRASNQSLLWKYKVSDVMYHGTAVADLDSDGLPELIIGCYNDTLYCINGDNGTTSWKYSYGSGFYMGAPATIADLDGDGECEIVFSCYYKVGALAGNGTVKWIYSIPGYEQAFRGCALADINNDLLPDVIFGTDGGKVIALNGTNGANIWTKNLASHYGNTTYAFDNAPLVSDFDNDDSLEVFIVGGHAEYPNFQNDFGRAYMITAGKGSGPDWLMFQRDIHRQSSLCEITPSYVIENNSTNPSVSVFPNPSSNYTVIKFPNSENQTSKLTIYNANGEVVYNVENIIGTEVKIENKNWDKSIYFFKLQNNEGIVGQGKFIVQ